MNRRSLFFISVNTAVPLQSFAAMELGRSDREQESLVISCSHPCGDLRPCLEKWINRPPGTLLTLFGAIWQNTTNHADREYRAAKNGGETGGGRAESKCVQVKGRVTFASPLTRKTPPGKAVWERKMPPRDMGYCKIG